jgi:AcrR family transcriptional regulator
MTVNATARRQQAGLRRRQLLAAADRVIRRRGPDASMDEIAAEAGVTKPILYRHFGHKDGLYAALVRRYLRAIYRASESALVETNPRRRIEAAVDAFLQSVEREPQIFRFVRAISHAEQPGAAGVAGGFVHRHADEIARAARQDLVRLGLDTDAAEPWAHGIVGMMQFVASWWLEHPEVPRERLADQVTTLLWEGFGHLHESR